MCTICFSVARMGLRDDAFVCYLPPCLYLCYSLYVSRLGCTMYCIPSNNCTNNASERTLAFSESVLSVLYRVSTV